LTDGHASFSRRVASIQTTNEAMQNRQSAVTGAVREFEPDTILLEFGLRPRLLNRRSGTRGRRDSSTAIPTRLSVE